LAKVEALAKEDIAFFRFVIRFYLFSRLFSTSITQ